MNNANYWEARHKARTVSNNEETTLARKVVSVSTKGTTKILEVGFGEPTDAKYFASNHLVYVGTDFCETAVRRAQESCKDLEFHQVDTQYIGQSFTLNSFDIIYARLSLHYFNRATTFSVFQQIRNLLTDSGLFFFAVRSTDDPEAEQARKQGAMIEENMYDDTGPPGSAHPYDDMSGYPDSGEDSACLSPNPGGANSASSPGGIAVPTLSLNMNFMGGSGNGSPGGLANGSSMSVLGKPVGTNNFVTKLYQMITDPKSSHFIAWTELGTSFVVSNVGEFSRSILGAHFKHNNFSSFVRQLNMYGFHKINRTPRVQRTTSDAQTWEFSHHKFLRGRPDLLDEIKRKALEPDPGIKHRVELPGEVAAQLGAMREENRRMWEQLANERRKVEKLVSAVGRLWDVVSKGFPGSVPPFPADLVESIESPNIYITSPTSSTARFPPPPPLSMGGLAHSMHSVSSPNSSPTAADFPTHLHHHNGHSHSLSRQQSFQHMSFSRGDSSPMPPSPGSITMDLFDEGSEENGRGSVKRQRLSNDDSPLTALGGGGSGDSISSMSALSSPGGGGPVGIPGKKLSRARSDSAPLGYGLGGGLTSPANSWHGAGRPRSGSGLAPQRGIPNIGSMGRIPGGQPLLSISTVPSNAPAR